MRASARRRLLGEACIAAARVASICEMKIKLCVPCVAFICAHILNVATGM